MDKVQRTVYSKYSMQDVLVLRWSERTVQYKSQPKTKEKRVDRICACQLRVRRQHGSNRVAVASKHSIILYIKMQPPLLGPFARLVNDTRAAS